NFFGLHERKVPLSFRWGTTSQRPVDSELPLHRGEHEVSFHSEGKQSMTSLQPYLDWEANGPSYLADIDVEEETKSTTEEVWHVAIAWDDIKTMTLDQLDDAFRLDVIAADTPVWKEGMSGWQPLSVVAGMDDDDEAEEATVMRPAPIPAPRA